jgi:DNA-directed RNA polymerase specialized sigma24 family protein
MKETSYKDIFLSVGNDKNIALDALERKLFHDCFPALNSMASGWSNEKFNKLFKDTFCAFWQDIELSKFRYESDSALLAYFKTKCKLKVFDEFKRIKKENSLISFQNEFEEAEYEFWDDKKERYGIDVILNNNEEDDYLERLYMCFRELGAKCQMLVFLKFWLGFSHDEIASHLTNLYDVNNEQSSRVQLFRCMQNLAKVIGD